MEIPEPGKARGRRRAAWGAACLTLAAAVVQGLDRPCSSSRMPCAGAVCLPRAPEVCVPETRAGIGKARLAAIHGRVQWVKAFPDYKVKVVDAFPDLKVQIVTTFPDASGKWQIVDAFPDYKIQRVDAFPDFTIKFVDAFPGTD